MMKKNIINSVLLATLLFVGCKKNNDRYPFNVDLKRVPYVNVTTDPTGSGAIDVLNLGNFSGKYIVDVLYKNDVPPAKVDVVMIKNGDKSTVKVLQAGVTTFPSTFTVTGAQLASLFGTPAKLGDNYDIGTDIYTVDGTKYEAFPNASSALLAYSGTGQANQPGFSPTTRFSAICGYDPSIYVGAFKAKDGFGDADGATIVLTKVSNNSFSFLYPSVLGAKPIIVTVNTGNNSVSIASQSIGTAWDPAFGYVPAATYINPTAATAAAGGTVAPCDKTVSIKISWGYNGNIFGGGPYTLLLTKL
ncbi:MAG: hypothetical protein ACR2KX_09750 [Chitinophagaceae bacterium]